MGKTYEAIDDALRAFLLAQRVFFVGSAPAGGDGHVNVSPKGLDSFRILGPRAVAYLDLTGSGVETIAHLRENGRITLLFCAFEGPPKIVRLYGRGEVVDHAHPDFGALAGLFPTYLGARSVIRVALERIADSCGYGVPTYRWVGERRQLLDWADRKGPDGVREYRRKNNTRSIDGLPGIRDE
ncbi:MAG TPA: pyridoxamine 5'-phosphate oxidase family protein [Candidatus Binatia bacterium]|nr:pyridoxamine 5'-phosphate oxidase family protein [Candidatus Binatia bacterium]